MDTGDSHGECPPRTLFKQKFVIFLKPVSTWGFTQQSDVEGSNDTSSLGRFAVGRFEVGRLDVSLDRPIWTERDSRSAGYQFMGRLFSKRTHIDDERHDPRTK
jgi:hypothetical protein